ncbi:MAG: ribonuclease E/G, partial [Paracoccaceae bacterium]|nr:ribonuclease E/G [Paracoccaceae bacterium]
ETDEAPAKPKRTRRPRKKAVDQEDETVVDAPDAPTEVAAETVVEAETEEKPKRKRAPRKKKVEEPAAETAAAEVEKAPDTVEAEAEEKPKRKRAPRKKAATKEDVAEPTEAEKPADAPTKPEPVPEPAQVAKAEPAGEPDPVAAKPEGPKRRGWWSVGR